MKNYLFSIFMLTLNLLSAQDFSNGFQGILINDKLSQPTSIAFSHDGRIFISEKTGSVRIFRNNQLLADPFLNIGVEVFGEQGLLAVELDPNFEQNNYIYAFYTPKNYNQNRLSRFTANGNFAIPNSELVLFETDQLTGITHHGGGVRFGADGKIYFSTGDSDHSNNPQDLNITLGKILRINSDGTIPVDNPFYNSLTGNDRAIWAYGLRNPNTFDFDSISNRFFINDVGGALFEEINILTGGKNYGWPLIEGFIGAQTPPANYQDPFFSYPHNANCAITGGTFYQSEHKTFPENYWNKYFFIDFCSGNFLCLNPNTGLVTDTISKNFAWINYIRADAEGDIYALGVFGGQLWKISYNGSNAPLITQQPKNKLIAVGENVEFNIDVVGSDTLIYNWYLNGSSLGINNDTLKFTNVLVTSDGDSIYCIVKNNLGSDTSVYAILNVKTGTRPSISILSPIPSSNYSAGDTIIFKAIATDIEDGNLSPSAISWEINFKHNVHYHPVLDNVLNDSGAFIIPRFGELDTNVWYHIKAEAIDSKGLTQNAQTAIYPLITNYSFFTSPDSLNLIVDGPSKKTPFFARGIRKKNHYVNAPNFQIKNDSLFQFNQWQNGNNNPDTIFTVNQNSLTANYIYVQDFHSGTGDGLFARYYNTIDLSGPVIIQKIDTTINFNFNWGSPHDSIQADNYSCNWTGYLKAPVTGLYTFYANFDEGARITFDDSLMLDLWTIPAAQLSDSFTVNLTGGFYYALDLTMFEELWQSRMVFKWRTDYFSKDVVPKKYLYSSGNGLPLGKIKKTNIFSSVFPNPASDQIRFISGMKNSKLKIFSYTGELIKEYHFDEKINIDVSNYKSGIYIYDLGNGEMLKKGKFIKQ